MYVEPPYGADTTGTSTITDQPVGTVTTLTETKQRYTIPEDITSNQDAKTSNETNIARVIVIAIDQSNYSRNAFEWAKKNFLRSKTDLVVLVNARPISLAPGPYAMGASYMDFSEVMVELEDRHKVESHNLLHEYATKLKDEKFECKAIAMRGDAREEIVRKVSELNADALVLGSRGLGAIKRLIVGSVSDHCIHHCHCSVIVFKEHSKNV
ncbi:hypothetical protein Glove_433g15 [Diversispora epigaea]|uniref:UspA domain-containing protein n=1 Tax=Diversispora epigaea TaxID=1348612 RepID=A0A397GTG5_9GLOM|nr:hypothetical protein Glove_433g15 [Diversispora epigaea]